MIKPAIRKLEQVALRDVWQHESLDFTPWLAENISMLAEKLGMSLEVEDVEYNVGSFKADIVAKDLSTNKLVLIENQLDGTDHSHLGQLITYASGLDAVTIIWIARDFRDEHISALDWLNRMTAKDISFYGIHVELWKIGDELAVNFERVSKPNIWTKSSNEYVTSRYTRLSPSETEYRLEVMFQSFLKQGKKPTGRSLAEATGINKLKTTTWLKTNHPEYFNSPGQIQEEDAS